MNLNFLAEGIHQISRDKGFWPAGEERNPFEVLNLIHDEVSEASEEIRDGNWKPGTEWKRTNRTVGPELEFGENGIWTVGDFPRPVTDEELDAWGFDSKPTGLPSELADIIIRTLDAAFAWNIDIDAALHAKIKYNTTRPQKHGRKR